MKLLIVIIMLVLAAAVGIAIGVSALIWMLHQENDWYNDWEE